MCAPRASQSGTQPCLTSRGEQMRLSSNREKAGQKKTEPWLEPGLAALLAPRTSCPPQLGHADKPNLLYYAVRVFVPRNCRSRATRRRTSTPTLMARIIILCCPPRRAAAQDQASSEENTASRERWSEECCALGSATVRVSSLDSGSLATRAQAGRAGGQ